MSRQIWHAPALLKTEQKNSSGDLPIALTTRRIK
jgi:hypothetical protein